LLLLFTGIEKEIFRISTKDSGKQGGHYCDPYYCSQCNETLSVIQGTQLRLRVKKMKKISIILLLVITCVAITIVLAVNKKNDDTDSVATVKPQCGHYAIQRCCEILGVPVDINQLVQYMPINSKGHNLLTLSKVLKKIGLKTKGVKINYESLTKLKGPVIVHIQPEHWVVVVNATDKYVTYFDNTGRRKRGYADRFKRGMANAALKAWVTAEDLPLPKGNGNSPRAQFETLILDNSDINSIGKPVEFVFPLRNLGESDLIIGKIKTDCTCVGFTKTEKSIPPGKEGFVKLKYDVTKFTGAFFHTALVQTNDPLSPQIPLTVSGNRRVALNLSPEKLDFGRITNLPGKEYEKTLCIKNQGDLPLMVSQVSHDVENLHIKVDISMHSSNELRNNQTRRYKLIAQDVYIVTITIKPEKEFFGKTEGKLCFITEIEGYDNIYVPIVAEVTAPVMAFPRIVFLGENKVDEDISQTIFLKSLENGKFRIISFDSGNTGLKCEYEKGYSENLNLNIFGKQNVNIIQNSIKIDIQMMSSQNIFTLDLPLFSSIQRN